MTGAFCAIVELGTGKKSVLDSSTVAAASWYQKIVIRLKAVDPALFKLKMSDVYPFASSNDVSTVVDGSNEKENSGTALKS